MCVSRCVSIVGKKKWTDLDRFFGANGLPDVLIRQIWLYTMKCPHDGLETAILRRALTPHIYDRLIEEKGIIVEDGHVVRLDIFDEDMALEPHSC